MNTALLQQILERAEQYNAKRGMDLGDWASGAVLIQAYGNGETCPEVEKELDWMIQYNRERSTNSPRLLN